MQCPRRAPTMVPISNVYRSGSRSVSEIFSRLKKLLKMNHPRMNPDTKRMEYHLRPKEPIWKITGSTCQWTNNISNIRKYINSPFRLSIYNLVRPNNLQIYAYFRNCSVSMAIFERGSCLQGCRRHRNNLSIYKI